MLNGRAARPVCRHSPLPNNELAPHERAKQSEQQMTKPIKLLLVAGARPNFMKIAPVIREIKRRADTFSHVLVHTGQHYDEGMSDVFFRDLGIPKPDHHLNVGSGSHATQTANIMTSFEPVLEQEKPDCVLVFGDVNSTLACSIVAKKLCYPVAHVEAGLRSGDRTMPEEINRIVTDSISDYFFVTEESGMEHLKAEGKAICAVFHVGHVMIDNLLYEVARLDDYKEESKEIHTLKSSLKKYGVVTMHRPSNVDEKEVLKGILDALSVISTSLPLVFPVHPRTKAKMRELDIALPPTITLLEPLGYRAFLELWKDAALVLTDSGGLQEETTGLGVPCLTLRTNTERPVTVDGGTNRLVGVEPTRIIEAATKVMGDAERSAPKRPLHWDGNASVRIIDVLAAKHGADK
jgi:UDP-N-acetylglucosamine 2-epimerase (non-hydrolysing)